MTTMTNPPPFFPKQLAEAYVAIVHNNGTEQAVLDALRDEPNEIRYELDETAGNDLGFDGTYYLTEFMDAAVQHVTYLLEDVK